MTTHDTSSTRSTEKDAAPAPEDPRKPDSPDDITKRSWQYVLRKTLREFSEDQCTDLAAALTYYAVLAIFPGPARARLAPRARRRPREDRGRPEDRLASAVPVDETLSRSSTQLTETPSPVSRSSSGSSAPCGPRRATSARSAGR